MSGTAYTHTHTHTQEARHIKTHTPHKYEGTHSQLASLLSLVSGDTAPTEQPGSISAEHDFHIKDWQFLYKTKGVHLCMSAGVYMRVQCVYNACLSRQREDVKETEGKDVTATRRYEEYVQWTHRHNFVFKHANIKKREKKRKTETAQCTTS